MSLFGVFGKSQFVSQIALATETFCQTQNGFFANF